MKPKPMASVKPKARVDATFVTEFRHHVGSSFSCECDLTGPAKDCDVGQALYAVAFYNREPIFQRNLNVRS